MASDQRQCRSGEIDEVLEISQSEQSEEFTLSGLVIGNGRPLTPMLGVPAAAASPVNPQFVAGCECG